MISADAIRDLVAACELLLAAEAQSDVDAREVFVASAKSVLHEMGHGVYVESSEQGRVRGFEPAYRIERTTDYVIRNLPRAAAIARSESRKRGRGLCAEEPLEEDAMGVLLGLLDLEVPLEPLEETIDILSFKQTARALTRSERSASRP